MTWGTGSAPKPEPREFWATSKGRTVEILASDTVTDEDGYPTTDVVAYKFLGGQQVHLRAVHSLHGWQKVEFQ